MIRPVDVFSGAPLYIWLAVANHPENIHFKSDIDAGFAIGRGVGQKVIERAKNDLAQ